MAQPICGFPVSCSPPCLVHNVTSVPAWHCEYVVEHPLASAALGEPEQPSSCAHFWKVPHGAEKGDRDVQVVGRHRGAAGVRNDGSAVPRDPRRPRRRPRPERPCPRPGARRTAVVARARSLPGRVSRSPNPVATGGENAAQEERDPAPAPPCHHVRLHGGRPSPGARRRSLEIATATEKESQLQQAQIFAP
jgi:hypothetical protein